MSQPAGKAEEVQLSNTVTASKKTTQPQKDPQVLKLLQEDEDDFQQFEEDAYAENPPEKIEAKQWREDWDDQDFNDDFASQLKKELQN